MTGGSTYWGTSAPLPVLQKRFNPKKSGVIIKWIQNWWYKIDQIKRRPTPKSFSASECLCIPCTDSNRLNLVCHQVKNVSSSWLASAFTNANANSKIPNLLPKQIDSPWRELLQVQAEVQAPPPCDNPLNVTIWFNDPKYGLVIQNMFQQSQIWFNNPNYGSIIQIMVH